MRVLSCVWRSYYGDPVAVNPNYLYFVESLRRLGHDVCFFDHVQQARLCKEAMNDAFLALVRGGSFDIVFVEMLSDEFFPEVLAQASEMAVTVAFNSDDDFRWMDYSMLWYPCFRYSVTTYRHIHEHFQPSHPRLILSPWGCGFEYEGTQVHKDIPISFAGGIHAERAVTVARLQKRVPIEVYGHGAGKANATAAHLRRIIGNKLRGGNGSREALRQWLAGRLDLESSGMSFSAVNGIWNRTRISWTPLELGDAQHEAKLRMARQLGFRLDDVSSPWVTRYQVKGRVFELGSSGTLMLCNRNEMIEDYYTRGVHYDDFQSEEEFVEKANYYLSHESVRSRIALAYYDRTKAEHNWTRRFRHIFSETGVA